MTTHLDTPGFIIFFQQCKSNKVEVLAPRSFGAIYKVLADKGMAINELQWGGVWRSGQDGRPMSRDCSVLTCRREQQESFLISLTFCICFWKI